jgi:all-trans-retinol 13,14-reductase
MPTPRTQNNIEHLFLWSSLNLNSDRCAIYGIPWVPERLDQKWISSKTPIKNLYLTGCDVVGHGIVGTMHAPNVHHFPVIMSSGEAIPVS